MRLENFFLNLLVAFEALLEERSVTRAARRLNVTQSAMSASLKVLDAIYELQLDNAEDPTAMIMHPRTNLVMAKLKDGDLNPLSVPEMVARVPRLLTTSASIAETQGTATL